MKELTIPEKFKYSYEITEIMKRSLDSKFHSEQIIRNYHIYDEIKLKDSKNKTFIISGYEINTSLFNEITIQISSKKDYDKILDICKIYQNEKRTSNMKKYRKITEVIFATEITDEVFDGDHPNPLHVKGVTYNPANRTVIIVGVHGFTAIGNVGDFILKSINGDLHIISRSMFLILYEEIEQ